MAEGGREGEQEGEEEEEKLWEICSKVFLFWQGRVTAVYVPAHLHHIMFEVFKVIQINGQTDGRMSVPPFFYVAPQKVARLGETIILSFWSEDLYNTVRPFELCVCLSTLTLRSK